MRKKKLYNFFVVVVRRIDEGRPASAVRPVHLSTSKNQFLSYFTVAFTTCNNKRCIAILGATYRYISTSI